MAYSGLDSSDASGNSASVPHVSGSCVASVERYTATSGWETSLVVRNLFDETGYNYISSSNYGDSPEIGWNDPRWKYVRSLQRPRTISLSFTKKW